MPPSSPLLLGDIGGTNLRLALHQDGQTTAFVSKKTKSFPSLDAAIADYLAEQRQPPVEEFRLAIAGPVANGTAHMTNRGWMIDANALAKRFNVHCVRLLNDFEANAWALDQLGANDRLCIGPATKGRDDAPHLVLGPGTGLGMACLVGPAHRRMAIQSEGGHVTLAPSNTSEASIIEALRVEFGHVSAERVLSGPGLEALYNVLVRLDGLSVAPLTSHEIVAAAREIQARRQSNTASETVKAFLGFLAAFAGDAALTFAAEGSVSIAGGIVPQLLDLLDAETFRTRFANKGRFRGYLENIPVHVILRPDLAFVGLAAMPNDL